jgi:ribose 1,5-bisphosphokinase PhnN
MSGGEILGMVAHVDDRTGKAHVVSASAFLADTSFVNVMDDLADLAPPPGWAATTTAQPPTSEEETASPIVVPVGMEKTASPAVASDGMESTASPAVAPDGVGKTASSTVTPDGVGKTASSTVTPDGMGKTASSTAARDGVEWVSDAPAHRDLLNRRPIATMIDRRLRRMVEGGMGGSNSDAGSFLIHVDGPWGSGKSTILNFLRAELEVEPSPWLVVDVNAWRVANVGPSWWTLLTALHARILGDLDWRARLRMRMAEAWRRGRVTGAPYALSVALIVALAGTLVLALGPRQVLSSHIATIATAVTAVLVAASAIWAVVFVVSRFFLWDSPVGARLFEQSNRDPMTSVREHFAWLVTRAGQPVVFFVDDLDRCDREYVVEFLDGIQTVARDYGSPPGRASKSARASGSAQASGPSQVSGTAQASNTARASTPEESRGPFFVVAADGRWIRACYEGQHADLTSAVSGPGQSLGYLFLDKLFQLTVTVPLLSVSAQTAFVMGLLARNANSVHDSAQERGEVERAIQTSTSQAEVQRAWRDANARVREEVAPLAVERLTEPSVEAQTEHDLQKFSVLLDRNPRRIKRFLNTYTSELVTTGLGQAFPDPMSLALWTIIRMRWPTLADHLAANPEDIACVEDRSRVPNGGDASLAGVFGRRDLAEVCGFKPGGPLTAELVETLTGSAATVGPSA